MKKIATITVLIIMSLTINAQNTFNAKYFFKPRPIIENESGSFQFDLKPTIHIPALRFDLSSDPNTIFETSFVTSVGGGLTLQPVKQNSKNNRNKSTWSITPLIILLNGEVREESTNLEASYCFTLNFLNNIFQLGAGWDLGKIEEGEKRFFIVGSFGINLTNN